MKKYFLFLLLASLILSACTGGETSLVGTWSLISYETEGSSTPAVPGSQASITFNEDGTLAGTSGCNGFGGEYTVDGDQITFSGLISTLMACEEPLMSQEGAMFKALDGTASYNIAGDTLTITNNGTVLVFTASAGESYP